ncbi:hypothetical protein [Micromonospora maritima]|uniref:hypothetical protein n=1 Tax=Micromonospora maritima TaxID=986711 RepID=UPI00157DCCC9|nr:hypothetical protein [Micromonospora maritima]
MTVDLGDFASRTQWVHPAPTAGPGDPKIPTGPWAPTVTDKPTVDELIAHSRDVVADVYATIARHRRVVRGTDRDDLGQVA